MCITMVGFQIGKTRFHGHGLVPERVGDETLLIEQFAYQGGFEPLGRSVAATAVRAHGEPYPDLKAALPEDRGGA